MRQALVFFVLALLACKSRVEVRSDPVDAARDAARPAKHDQLLRGGEVFDLAADHVTHVLREVPPVAEVHDERRAFLFGKDFMLRAFDLGSGAEVWSQKIPTTLRPLLSDRRFVYVVADSVITAVSKESGEARAITVSKPIRHAAVAHGSLIVARSDRVVEIIDPSTGVGTAPLTLPFDPIGWHAALLTRADGQSACAIALDAQLQIVCFDTAGAVNVRVSVDLNKAKPGSDSFVIQSADERYVLYGAHPSSSARRSAIVRLSDGSVTTVEDRVAAIVEREDGTIAGLLAVEPELRLLDAAGKLVWTAKASTGHHDGAAAVARGNTVFIDTFPQFSSGSALEARDLKTGTLVWKADVEQLPIGHSEYFNEVRLSLHGERVLLRGDESSVITTQLFDVASGKRTLASSHHR